MSIVTRILCPVDFSEHSRHALDQAVALGRHYGAVVTALHVIPSIVPLVPSIDSPIYPPYVYTPEDIATVRQALDAFVESERAERSIETAVIEGQAVAEILAYADGMHADLIVMGTHGRSGVERLVLGSVAERVLAKANCPVMTVPPRHPDAVPAGPALFSWILCPIDFSPASFKALELAVSLARESGATLTLAHVVDATLPSAVLAGANPRDLKAALVAGAKAQVHALVPDDLVDRGLVRELVLTGKPSRTLVELAGEEGANLIVMGAHGGIAGTLGFGSTTNDLVRRVKCLVISVRA